MNQQPDRLFHDRLENFHLPAPQQAWSRIEANLDATNHKALWLKVAAGLTLLAVTTFLLWPEADQPNAPVAKQNIMNKDASQAEEKTSNAETAPVPLTTTVARKMPDKKSIHTEKLKQSVEHPINEEQEKIEDVIHSETLTAQVETTEPVTANETAQRVVLIYTADEVNQKFLRKKETTEATADDKKASRIQKLMGMANNLKIPENGLGDLRQMKDEILALNFLSEKNDQTRKN